MRCFRLHALGLFAAASLPSTGTGRRSAVAVLSLLLLLAWAPFAASRPVTPRGELSADERVTIDVFEKSKRSVVYISTAERVRDAWTRNVHSIPRDTGSGFVWDDSGHIVTNYHVIADAAEARIRLNDGRDYPAELVAIIRPSWSRRAHRTISPSCASGCHRIVRRRRRWAPATTCASASALYAIGNPFGLDWSLTTGIVSALDRALDGDDGNTIEHLIQTDAAINPGNSGGPLLESAGRLVGVNTAIYSPSGASAGIGFAVPIDTVNRVVTALIAHGKYAHPTRRGR